MLIASVMSILLSATAAAPPIDSSIIVTGRAIEDKRVALGACLARHCPPNEDIDASLALAETQLVAGKYREARVTLLAALGRDKKAAMAYPIPVADLYRANGRVAAQLSALTTILPLDLGHLQYAETRYAGRQGPAIFGDDGSRRDDGHHPRP